MEQRRLENARAHVEKVKQIEHIPDEGVTVSERQAELLIDWTDRARKVDPKDGELAALWQGLLAEIYRNEADAEEILGTLKELSAADAQRLLSLPDRWISPDVLEPTRDAKFRTLGLIESYNWRWFASRWSMPAFLSVFVYALAAVYLYRFAPETFDRDLLFPLLMWASLAAALPFALLLTSVGRNRLSLLGKRVRDSGLKYRSTVASEMKSRKSG